MPEPITGALDVDDDGMVKKPVQKGGSDHWISEEFAPFGKAAI